MDAPSFINFVVIVASSIDRFQTKRERNKRHSCFWMAFVVFGGWFSGFEWFSFGVRKESTLVRDECTRAPFFVFESFRMERFGVG